MLKSVSNLLVNLRGWWAYLLTNLLILLVLITFKLSGITFPFLSYPGLLIAMSAGFLGATFSMLIKSQERVSQGSLEDLTTASSWHTLIVRASVGLGAAAILYFFFESGLLEGSLWPDLKNLGFNQIESYRTLHVPNKNWCLLVIWCFLAGFSETFVPTMLNKTENKGTASNTNP